MQRLILVHRDSVPRIVVVGSIPWAQHRCPTAQCRFGTVHVADRNPQAAIRVADRFHAIHAITP